MAHVIKLSNGNFGICSGDAFTADDDWGQYADEATAQKALDALEATDWDANCVTG